MKNLLLITASLVLFLNAGAQFQNDVYRPFNGAKVYAYGAEKKLPWVGGVNAPQFSMADLNQDGKKDVVIYERSMGVKTVLATGNGGYVYDSKYESAFMEHNLSGYLTMVDYNRDGVPDMITRGGTGITVYKGYYDGGQLKFNLFKALYYSSNTGPINAYVEPIDIPAIGDVDGDGDIDFISYFVLGSQMTFYRNCQVEDGLPKDSIKICVQDGCWARTTQNYERTQLLGQWCGDIWKTCNKGSANKTTHSGNTLCMIDIDGDSDMDYFNGNVSFPDIQFFYNGKTEHSVAVDTAIKEDTIWAAGGKSMYMPMFPAAFAVDVDNDNDLDLLFSPNDANTENYKSVSYYKNTGSSSAPKFEYQSDTFLVEHMIDMGTGAYPLFYDYDRDGKKDLFIGSDGFYEPSTGNFRSKIAYYKNTSSNTAYSFTLQTDDFLGLYATNINGAALAIGDLDNDTLDDLVIGKSDGTFAFYKNTAATPADQPVWVQGTNAIIDATTSKVLDVGDFAAPAIYDIDADGKNDLISGNQVGDLYYFNNYSSQVGLVGLKEINKNLGGVKIFDSFQVYGYSVPYFGPMDNTGKDYLVVGSYWGELFRYDGFQNGAMPAKYTKIDSVYSWINVRQRAAPAFANVDNDAKNLYEMVIGNTLGGVTFYKQDFPVSVSDWQVRNMDVKVYPNPAKNDLAVSWQAGNVNDVVTIQIVSITGQQLINNTYNAQQSTAHINIANLASGMYYAIVQSNGQRVVKPVTILK
ncbi:MAG: T9SS type A sorting domain-containing protein [Chitinophagales bacterium]|nr:T9SS type A sorting domain-containing protein [Chitinophagaceae bacterium]MCB9065885.1 T9SS type A sorting domain-containing protein [Chitinophagales bacterium]